MNPNQAEVGDMIVPNSLWNQTERKPRNLSVPTRLLGKKNCTSQTGVLFLVKTLGGQECWLDAGWFTGKTPAVEGQAEGPQMGLYPT